MEIKPPSGPAAVPEPDDAAVVAPPAGHVKAKLSLPTEKDQLGVYQPPLLDFGAPGLERLRDASDVMQPPGGLADQLPGGFDTGPTGMHYPHPTPPEPPPPPPDEFVSKLRLPREGLGAYSPEIGGTEQGPEGNPKRPAIRHGLGPGQWKSPVPGTTGPDEPGGFKAPGTPHPTDPRASAPVEPPPPQPSPPDPDDPDDAAISGLVLGLERQRVAGYQDGDDLPAAAGQIVQEFGAAALGEAARGVSDPGPPTNPPDPPPK